MVSVGVRPAATLAAAAGAQTGPAGALLVDAEMRTSLPGVWAAGDCIAPLHRVTGMPAYVPLGTTANKTGRVAGTVAAGGSASFPGIVGTAVVKVFDLEVARTGITLAEARAAGIEAVATDVVHRSRAKYYPGGSALHVRLVHGAGGRLLGAQMVGREGAAQRIDVLATALQTGMTVGDLTALDLAYAPPYSPVYDPILIAAESAARRVEALMTADRRVALVTGGASGIGQATCRRLLADGFVLAVGDLDADGAADAAGPEGYAAALDVADEASVEEFVAAAVAKLGRIDVLVNNAGISGDQTATVLHSTPVAEWDRVIAVERPRPVPAQPRGAAVDGRPGHRATSSPSRPSPGRSPSPAAAPTRRPRAPRCSSPSRSPSTTPPPASAATRSARAWRTRR